MSQEGAARKHLTSRTDDVPPTRKIYRQDCTNGVSGTPTVSQHTKLTLDFLRKERSISSSIELDGTHLTIPHVSLQAVNLRGFHTSMNPRFEGGIPDFMEKFNKF